MRFETGAGGRGMITQSLGRQILSLLCMPNSTTPANLVRNEGLEPPILSALVSKTSVYAIPPIAHYLVHRDGFEPSRFL